MEAALAAARLGDGIEHSNAMLGFLVGAAVGLAVGVALLGAVVAAPFTGGLSLCAGAAAVAALGGIVAGTGAGALAGMTLGGLFTSAAGPIVTGSHNVLTNTKPQARAVLDTVLCTNHSAPPKRIAQGSETVVVNNMPAARRTEKTECDGTIAAGSPDVFIGGPTGTFLPISSEVPAWLQDTAKWMMIIGGGVALGAGLFAAALGGLAAVGAFVGNVAMGVALSAGGKVVGGALGEALWGEKGRIAGETLGELAGIPGARNAIRGLRGHPIDVATGELVIEQADFDLPGPLPLTWARRWSSGSAQDGELGFGWSHPFDMAVEILPREGLAKARLEDGRLAFFPIPQAALPSLNLSERLVLHVDGDGYRIADYNGTSFCLAAGTDGLFRLHAVRDPAGNAIRLTRAPDGRLVELEDSGGRRLAMRHDEAGRIVEIVGPHPTDPQAQQRLVAYQYGPQGDLVAAIDPRGARTQYRADRHLIVEEQRRSGLTFRFVWDDPGRGRKARCIETWGDDRLYYCHFTYLPDEQATVVADDRGQETLYRYDRNGLVVLERDPLDQEQTWQWSQVGALLAYSDGAGRTSSWAYDAFNRLTRQASPDGASVTTGYAPVETPADLASPTLGLPVFATLPDGAVRHYGYDARGGVATIETPLGRVVRFLRDARGLPLAISDQAGVMQRFGWDSAGRLEWQQAGTGDRVAYAYDLLGRIAGVADDGDQTRYDRDPAGNITRIERRGDGAVVTLAYDTEGKVVHHRDARGAETRWDYAGLPQPVSRTGADGATIRYHYDRTLALVGIENAKGERHLLERDAIGRVVREVGVDGRETRYRYDAGDRLIERHAADGTTRYLRDDAGQVVRQLYPDGRRHDFSWDAAGRLIAATTPDRAIALRYDAGGQVVAETQGTVTVAHRYDLRGRRVATELPDGRIIRTDYDPDGGFNAIAIDGDTIVRLERDARGREVTRRAGAVEVLTEYDPEGRLVQQAGRQRGGQGGGQGGGAVLDRRYHYDPHGRLLALEDMTRGTKRFRYDAAERLVGVDGATPEAFVTDPAGNVLPVGAGDRAGGGAGDGSGGGVGRAVQGDATGDRLRVWGDRRFEYDADGRRVRELRGAGTSTQLHYAYNGAGQLAEVVERSRRGTRTTRYGYDALGRRVFKDATATAPRAANEADPPPAPRVVRTVFTWDGDVLLAEAVATPDAAPADPLATLYLHEPGSFRPVAQLRRAAPDAPAAVHHYHLDALGTPQELTNDNGRITWRADLKAWGGVARQAEAEIPNPIRFQGQYADEETGLHYNRCRYYDPVVARYVTPDPIGLAGGPNAYAYVPDPTSWVDPLGLTACRFDWKAGRLREVDTGRFHPWRPDPKSYMSARDIDAHLSPFRGGAAKIVPDAPTRAVGPPQGHYVMTRADADAVIAKTGGDPRLIEKELSLDNGWLGSKPQLVAIDNPQGLRMPSGNEPGANADWIRGGFTKGGVREAVIDQTPLSDVKVFPIPRSP